MANSLILTNNGLIVEDQPDSDDGSPPAPPALPGPFDPGATLSIQPGTIVDGVFQPAGDKKILVGGDCSSVSIDPPAAYLIQVEG